MTASYSRTWHFLLSLFGLIPLSSSKWLVLLICCPHSVTLHSVTYCCCSVTYSCLTLQRHGLLTPGFPVLHTLLEFAQTHVQTLLLLLSHFSRVRLCATPQTAAHQAPPSLGFSRQEHWSGLPFPSPMHESEKWKWSRSVASDSLRPHGLQPSRLLHPWDSPGKSTGVGCHCLLRQAVYMELNSMACATEAKWCSKGNIQP